MSLVRHTAVFLLGVAVSLAALAVHRTLVLGQPVGLLLGLATTFAVAWALRSSPWPRLMTTYAAGWVVLLGLAAVGRPEGDLIVVADTEGYALIGGGLVLAMVAVLTLAASHPESEGREP